MSRIEELIKQKCPEGVKYVPLNTVCEIYDGTHSTPKYMNQGIRFVSVENIGNLYDSEKYISEEDYCKFKITPRINDIFMTRIGSIGVCTVVDREEPLAYYVSLALLRPNVETLNSYFLKYAIESLEGQKELHKRTLVNAVPIKVNKDDIGKILVPVPPLDVQQEIVRILDKFTELEAELQAELAARKKQYEYYREELLSKGIPVMLSEVATYVKDRVNATEINASNYVGVDNILQNRAGKKDSEHYPTEGKTGAYKPNDVLIGNIRPYLKKIWFANCNGGTNGDVLVIRSLDEEKLLPEYLYHMLSSDRFFDYDTSFSKGGKMPRGDKEAIMKYQMMLPSVCEQRQIVDILNRFKDICSDVSNGLPAEIEARHKQYEYYRDKLLTFERKVV